MLLNLKGNDKKPVACKYSVFKNTMLFKLYDHHFIYEKTLLTCGYLVFVKTQRWFVTLVVKQKITKILNWFL